MKFLITINTINDSEVNSVNARDLWENLEVKTAFTTWFQRKLDESMFVEGQDFISILEESNGGRPSKKFIITIEMAKHLAMSENNGKGFEVRQYFIEAEKELRVVQASTPAIPQTFAQALLLAAQQAQAIELMVPKVNTYDAIMDTASSFLLGEAGNAVGVKTNKLSKFLCEKRYIFKLGASKYKPYAKYLEQGLFAVKLAYRDEESTSAQLRVTSKGVELLHSLVDEYDAWHKDNYGSTGKKKAV